jgi:ATP-binding cassette subfamily B protein
MGWGGGGGGALGAARGAGLPFGGIPPELKARAELLTADEPNWDELEAEFDPVGSEHTEPLTLRSLLRPHRWRLAIAILLVGIGAVAAQAGPYLTKIGIDRGVEGHNLPVLLGVGVAYVVVVLISGVVSSMQVSYTGRLGQSLLFELRVRVFTHIQRLSLDFFTGERAGRIMSRMTSDIETTNQLLQNGLPQLAVQAITLVVVTAILFAMDVRLALITVVAIVPTLTVLTLWFRSASDRAYNRVRDGIAAVLADLQESLAGVRTVTAFNRRDYNIARHRGIVATYRAAEVSTATLAAIYQPATTAIGIGAEALVLGVGGDMALRGELSIGTLVAFLLYVTSFFTPIQQLVQLYSTYQAGQAAIGKLGGLLATKPSVREEPDAVELPRIEGRVTLEGVGFSYEPGTEILHDVDLVVEPGETLALVGPTGAGKSTVVKLISRLYDPTAGRVLLDGIDVRTVTLASLRRQVVVVPQEPFLFAGTVRDNVTFARPDAPQDEVDMAIHAVGLEELIARLAKGLDTLCSERGNSFSAGERQLLALARAFIARPRVLVLDEATSNLDPASEARAEAALDRLLVGRTSIVVAHRLSTAMRANRIAVVDEGAIAEIGTHDELLAQGGRYAAMFEIWMRSGNAPSIDDLDASS